MIGGQTLGVVIAGDPSRNILARYLFDCYSSYACVDAVALMFRKNPALAFNEGAERIDADSIVCVGGDIYIGERELERFASHPADVVFAVNPMYPRKIEGRHHYLTPWQENGDPFVSGAFRCRRELLLRIPMPIRPNFSEDILWEPLVKADGKTFQGVQVPCAHIDFHGLLPKLRNFVWVILAPTRYRDHRGAFWILGDVLVKAFAWEIWTQIGARRRGTVIGDVYRARRVKRFGS